MSLIDWSVGILICCGLWKRNSLFSTSCSLGKFQKSSKVGLGYRYSTQESEICLLCQKIKMKLICQNLLGFQKCMFSDHKFKLFRKFMVELKAWMCILNCYVHLCRVCDVVHISMPVTSNISLKNYLIS